MLKSSKKVDHHQQTDQDLSNDEEKMKKMLISASDDVLNGSGGHLAELLPTLRTDKNKPISDDNLEKLFLMLCGDTGKVFVERL